MKSVQTGVEVSPKRFASMKRWAWAMVQTAAVLCLTLAAVACNKNPVIQVSNASNECGGTLQVTGSGFTPGGQVQISATNTPGSPAVRKIASGTADGSGNISVPIPFSWPGPGALPGCANGSTDTATVTITATDVASSSPAFATIALRNCGMAWSVCPA